MVKFVSSFSFLSQYSEEIISFLHDQNIKGRSFEIRMEFAKQQMFSGKVYNFFEFSILYLGNNKWNHKCVPTRLNTLKKLFLRQFSVSCIVFPNLEESWHWRHWMRSRICWGIKGRFPGPFWMNFWKTSRGGRRGHFQTGYISQKYSFDEYTLGRAFKPSYTFLSI